MMEVLKSGSFISIVLGIIVIIMVSMCSSTLDTHKYDGHGGSEQFWVDYDKWSIPYRDMDGNGIIKPDESEKIKSQFLTSCNLRVVDGFFDVYDKTGQRASTAQLLNCAASWEKSHPIN